MRLYEFKNRSVGRPRKVTPLNITDEDQIVEYIQKTTPQAYDKFVNGVQILRGDRTLDASTLTQIDTSGSYRLAQNTENFFTLLFDETFGNKFPKRTESLVCSLSFEKTKMYGGEVFAIFPYDNTIIGRAGTDDFWDSFYTMSPSVFNSFLSLYLKIDDVPTLAAFKQELKGKEDRLVSVWEDNIGMWEGTLEKSFYEVFKYNQCKVDNINSLSPGDDEVWFSGKCLALPLTIARKFGRELV